MAFVSLSASLAITIAAVSSDSAGAAKASAAAPKGAITVITGNFVPPTLDREADPSGPVLEIGINVNEPLVRTKTGASVSKYANAVSSSQFVPAACAKFSFTSDNLHFICDLAHIKSAYGNYLNTADFTYLFKYIAHYNRVGVLEENDASISLTNPLTIVSPTEIEINFTTPNADALAILSRFFFDPPDSTEIMANATAADPLGLNWLTSHTGGYGAYYATAFVPNESVTLSANPNYVARAGSPAPSYATINYRLASDLSTAEELLNSNSAQVYKALEPSDLGPLKHSKDVNLITWSEAFTTVLYMNLSTPPFNNIHVRRAVACAISRADISATGTHGIYAPAYSLLVPAEGGYSTTGLICKKPNLAFAKAQLKLAGFPNGVSATLSYSPAVDPTAQPDATLLEGELAKVGINLTLNNVANLSTYQFTNLANRQYQIALFQLSNAVPNADYTYSTWFLPGGTDNFVSGESPLVGPNINKLLSLPVNSGPANKLAETIQSELLNPVNVVPIVNPAAIYAVSKSICGVNEDPAAYLYWQYLHPCK